MMNEFEKYPELAEQMQEYAAFGKFGNWQKFTDVLNETLKQVNKNIVLADVSGEYCPICKSDDLVDIDDHYTKCCKCGFSFVG